MLKTLICSISLIVLAALCCLPVAAQASDVESYRLQVAVDEVGLTFHAADTHGLPVNDLKQEEVKVLDNGKPARKIVSFEVAQDYPIRAGILVDTSKSMEPHLHGDRAIAAQFAQRVLRQKTDSAFLMEFGYTSVVTQPWSGDATTLANALRRVVAGRQNSLGGTALFDAVFHACFNEFGKVDHAGSGNFILLFSDGEDNASHTSLIEAVDMCQRSNTAIYAFRADPAPGSSSSGPKTLVDLTEQTGGRVFHDDDSEAAVYADLRVIEGEMRNQYRLVYKPAELAHDGAFHRIELRLPERVDTVTVRTGYYAPGRPKQ